MLPLWPWLKLTLSLRRSRSIMGKHLPHSIIKERSRTNQSLKLSCVHSVGSLLNSCALELFSIHIWSWNKHLNFWLSLARPNFTYCTCSLWQRIVAQSDTPVSLIASFLPVWWALQPKPLHPGGIPENKKLSWIVHIFNLLGFLSSIKNGRVEFSQHEHGTRWRCWSINIKVRSGETA